MVVADILLIGQSPKGSKWTVGALDCFFIWVSLGFQSTKSMDEARQQVEVHGVSGSRSFECDKGVWSWRYFDDNLPSNMVENHPIVKHICINDATFGGTYFPFP